MNIEEHVGVTIKNGTVKGFNVGIGDFFGIAPAVASAGASQAATGTLPAPGITSPGIPASPGALGLPAISPASHPGAGGSQGNEIRGVTADLNQFAGIWLETVSSTTIEDCTANEDGRVGIFLFGEASSGTITNKINENTANKSANGIEVFSEPIDESSATDTATITNRINENTAKENGVGIAAFSDPFNESTGTLNATVTNAIKDDRANANAVGIEAGSDAFNQSTGTLNSTLTNAIKEDTANANSEICIQSQTSRTKAS